MKFSTAASGLLGIGGIRSFTNVFLVCRSYRNGVIATHVMWDCGLATPVAQCKQTADRYRYCDEIVSQQVKAE